MRTVRTLVALILLLAVSAPTVTAQDVDPFAPQPPDTLPKGRIGTFTNGFEEPRINKLVEEMALESVDVVEANAKWAERNQLTLDSARLVSSAAQERAELRSPAHAVVIFGGHQPFTVEFARRSTQTAFLDIAQGTPCVNADGRADLSGTCSGGTAAIPPNYMAVSFAEDESGYLAGIIAAAAAPNRRLAIIGGIPGCAACNRYAQGFELGARWFDPGIEIIKGFISDSDAEAAVAFTDANTAAIFTDAFIRVHRPDVLLATARANNRAITAAACELGTRIVGIDVDLASEQPEIADCVLTSATKPIGEAVRDAIYDFTNGELQAVKRYDLASGGVAITDEWTRVPGLPVDLPVRLASARDEIITGVAVTCPEHCGRPDPAADTTDEAVDVD